MNFSSNLNYDGTIVNQEAKPVTENFKFPYNILTLAEHDHFTVTILNIDLVPSQYKDALLRYGYLSCEDTTVVGPSYHYDGNSLTGMVATQKESIRDCFVTDRKTNRQTGQTEMNGRGNPGAHLTKT